MNVNRLLHRMHRYYYIFKQSPVLEVDIKSRVTQIFIVLDADVLHNYHTATGLTLHLVGDVKCKALQGAVGKLHLKIERIGARGVATTRHGRSIRREIREHRMKPPRHVLRRG